MPFRFLHTLALLVVFYIPLLGQPNPSIGNHPTLLVSKEDRLNLKQKIETESWANDSWEQLLAEIDPHVTRHQSDSAWIVSRLAMYWKEGERYTQCYIKGQDWDYGEGNAPVPTVRLPGMRRWNDYVNVPLERRTPFNETGDMWGISRSSGDTTPVLIPYKKTGHMIRNNNKEILELAEKAAFAYYITQEEKYAKFSSDILWTWLMGIYYMEPPLDPDQSTKGPGGYAPGGIMGYYDYEVIHDDRQQPAAVAYDFLHDYMVQNPSNQFAKLNMTVTDMAGTVFKRFIEIGLVRGGAKGNWNVNRYRHIISSMLVLESNEYYADGKGKEYYIPYYTQISGKHHDALPEIMKNYDTNTGLWPESPGYASGMIGAVLEMALPLYRAGVNTVGENPMIQKAAMANLGWLDARGNLVVFGDMRGGPLDYEVFERLYTYYTWQNNQENADKIATVLNKGVNSGQYDRSQSGWRSIILNQPLTTSESTLPYNRAAYSSFHRHLIMKNGNDDEDGMMFTLYGGTHQHHLSANGLAWQFYGKGWALAPDGAAYESYWSPDMKYYSGAVASNTIVQGYSKGDITVNAMDPFVSSDQFYNENTTSEYCSFADVSADEKRRLIAMVRTSPTTGYYVDIFRSDLEDNDYLQHILGNTMELKNAKNEVLDLQADSITDVPHPAYSFFENVRKVDHDGDFWSSWTIDAVSPELKIDMWMMGQTGRELYQVDAPPTTLRSDLTPGQVNKSPQVTPTLVVRQTGNNAVKSPFVGVFEAYEAGNKSIQGITTLATSDNFVSIQVVSSESSQYIYNATDDGLYKSGKNNVFRGIFGISSVKGKELDYLYLGKGKLLQYGQYQIEAIDAPATATLRSVDGKLYYSSDQPIRITLKKGKSKAYPEGYDVLID
ncbi:hypothetical protein N6H18_01370 [Reichenbachiella agarivorans]|uniref:Endo-acting ulvan lyase C-terminal domain-containing protein n=1 Tax=Reichenbachiella agarivorans TaxID=2979464 RepID=A0ABY6CQ20_9BACT|nr:hypothetical protein [Reichenbachiella agarivorans]UXP32619.1 hypothetical protein N6H18_01370 [Reichenbachiella agarivorans]